MVTIPNRDKVLLCDVGTIVKGYAKLGYQLKDNPYQANVLGIRSDNPATNEFDDAVGLIFMDFENRWNLRLFRATTDPGTYWLQNPMNVKGTAILPPGQYKNSHRLGKHKGQYDALVQAGPLKLWRDKNKDTVIDFTDLSVSESDGINIHRANPEARSTAVDKWSAGCQVIADGKVDYEIFMFFCRHSAAVYGLFDYTLFEQRQVFQ